MIKVVIFDLDGVIIDTDKERFKQIKELLTAYAISLEDDKFGQIVGVKTKVFLQSLFGQKISEEDIDLIYKKRIEQFYKEPEKYILPYPYALSCIKDLHEKGFILGVASSSSKTEVEFILKSLKIEKHFKAMVGAGMYQRFKPDKEPYEKCLQMLGISAKEAIAIEDSMPGITSAKSAGLFCIGITHVHQAEELAKADMIIDSLSEFTPGLIRTIKE